MAIFDVEVFVELIKKEEGYFYNRQKNIRLKNSNRILFELQDTYYYYFLSHIFIINSVTSTVEVVCYYTDNYLIATE